MGRSHISLKDLGVRLSIRPNGGVCNGRILIIDGDRAGYAEPLARGLDTCHFKVEACPEAAKRYLLSSSVDLVILNHSAGISAPDLLPLFKSLRPSVPVIVTTDSGSEDLAVQVFRHGAIDYFTLPFDIRELEMNIRAILEIRKKTEQTDNPSPVCGLQRALQYMGKNFAAPIRLDVVAREAGMSTSCFERYLKKQTGMTFVAYVNSLRIARAKELLQAGSTSILQVALVCGFNNQSHFNRVFKKITGTTPGAYRKASPSWR